MFWFNDYTTIIFPVFKKQEPTLWGFCKHQEVSIPLSLLQVAAPQNIKVSYHFSFLRIA
jgi:hypothetical protein